MTNIQGYTLMNADKAKRAVEGSMVSGGRLSGGIGMLPEKSTKEQVAEWEMKLLCEYDRLGGLIMKDDLQLKTGSFYNFEMRRPRKSPQVVFIERIEGETVEVTEEEAKAIAKTRKKTAEIKAKKKKKKS